ncbi:calcium-binding protein [Roseomonas sp. M0104]|uniref:Calcium-binding protein n=1 Tax=Teichococcus coralli TaxID=2545983 RepID=A0A845B613_9PROT|nr:calcium-binding protein [Pseudoroseomonas coralli]MXP63063.1 calcium-binding protein [Pseudoroseomonas coralli]
MPVVFGTQGRDEISPFRISAGVSGSPSNTAPNFIQGGGGDDTIAGGDAEDVIFGGDGDDTLSGSSTSVSFSSNYLFGGNGNDLLFGSTGDDFLDGGRGNDVLLGGDLEYDHGRDFLNGGAGDDVLDGRKGSDILLGGQGNDVFQFSIGITGPAPAPTTGRGAGSRDVILDFRQGEDVIDLVSYQTFYNGSGHPIFLGTQPFEEGRDLQVRYDIIGGHTIVQFRSAVNDTWFIPIDGEIDLLGVTHLTARDFHLS